MPRRRATSEDQECVKEPVRLGVWECLGVLICIFGGKQWEELTSSTIKPTRSHIAAKMIGMLLELILSLHQASANVDTINSALFGIVSRFELKVPYPKLLMMEGEYVPSGGEYSKPSNAIEQCIQTFQSESTERTIWNCERCVSRGSVLYGLSRTMRPRRMSVSRLVKEENGNLAIEFPRVGSRGRRKRVLIPTMRVAIPS